jgi:hypothetical protein
MSFEGQARSWLRWARTPGHERWQRLPNFLHLRAVKPRPMLAGDIPRPGEGMT